jgi:uncharacterized protein YjiS (DUF1127 family)
MLIEIGDLGRRFARWRRARRADGQLRALDDRMLKDMGVQRSQISMIARGVDTPYRGRR